MQDYSESAREELKRVDHLVYVSLKYTRTVDVIKSIIDRLISAIDFIIIDLLELKKNEITEDIPESPAGKASLVNRLYIEEKEITEVISFYFLLRKLSRAEYKKINEFRRHVTMIAIVDGVEHNIHIDAVTEYYAKIKEFWEKIEVKKRGSNE